MADVLLTVGVNPNIDFSQFEKDLDAIFSKYEKSKKHIIDVEFNLSDGSQSSLKSIDTALQSIQDRARKTAASLKSINTALQNSSLKEDKKASKNAQIYRDSVKAIKEYYDALKKLQVNKTDIVQIDGK